jgi:ribulose-5-phosphate 4-epimerase/fuculose-1-phosphate aldolase
MDELQRAITELTIANRILANENVVDAYGHVSLRHPNHPDRYLLACSRSPELVEREDIMVFTLEGKPVGDDSRPPYLERFIHGGIYAARPDIQAVVHAHSEDVLPFGISPVALVPVIHSGSVLGARIPVWDIAERFGTQTNLLVTNVDQGRDLAEALGGERAVLMRGHGFAAAGRTLLEVLRISIFMPRNARVQQAAMRMGGFKPLNPGEIAARGAIFQPGSSEVMRAWEYWARRAGCGQLLAELAQP